MTKALSSQAGFFTIDLRRLETTYLNAGADERKCPTSQILFVMEILRG
jgi:hypothetical protein